MNRNKLLWGGGVAALILVVLLVLNFATGEKEATQQMSEFAQELDEHEFFKFSESRELSRKIVSKDPEKLWDCKSGRVFHTDAEALADGFALNFINEEVGPLLKKLEALPSDAVWTEDSAHVIQVGEASYPFLSDPESGSAWQEVTRNTLHILNDLLSKAESKERAYGLYGGEDLAVVFLSEELFQIIKKNTSTKESDKPWETEPGS